MEKDFQAAHQLGKIYQSFLDKKLLCEFFLDNTLAFMGAREGLLYLSSSQGKMWLEAQGGIENGAQSKIKPILQPIFEKGQPLIKDNILFLPLVVQNGILGVVCFAGPENKETFTAKDLELGSDLSAQLAGALKNLTLYEDNVRMERLAAVGQTISVVLHEIKNILQLAKFGEEYLKMGVERNNPKFITRGVDGVKRALHEMDGFVYEMLSLTKHYMIHPEPFKLEDVFKELREDFKVKSESLKIKMDFTVSEELEEVYGEPRSLYRALVNLVKNAIEATDREKESSFIRVHARSLDNDHYEIVVEDNGSGMSDEAKAKVFQAFFSTKGEKGTGLGLMIIDRTVKAHLGQIKVESEYRKGTRFILKLRKVLASDEPFTQKKIA